MGCFRRPVQKYTLLQKKLMQNTFYTIMPPSIYWLDISVCLSVMTKMFTKPGAIILCQCKQILILIKFVRSFQFFRISEDSEADEECFDLESEFNVNKTWFVQNVLLYNVKNFWALEILENIGNRILVLKKKSFWRCNWRHKFRENLLQNNA